MILIKLNGLRLIVKKTLKRFERSKIFGVAIIDKDFSKDAMSKTQKVVMDSKEEMQQKLLQVKFRHKWFNK